MRLLIVDGESIMLGYMCKCPARIAIKKITTSLSITNDQNRTMDKRNSKMRLVVGFRKHVSHFKGVLVHSKTWEL